MSRLLVTGATGFIGSTLCRSLRRQGHEVTELSTRNGDIVDPATLSRVGPVQHVFHLAGRAFVPDSWNDPLEFHRVNVLGTANMLEFCRMHSAWTTYVSSYLYGVPERLPVSETCVPRPNNPYALSKYLAEHVCAFYADHHGVDVTVIRPFNVFGPDQKAPFLIPSIVGQIEGRPTIHVKDLAPRRDYLYIDDLVDALVKTMTGPRGYNIFNIGSGRSFSVMECITAIQSVAGTALPVVSDEEPRLNEIDDVYADIGKAQQLLGWTPTMTFEQGIERMIVGEAAA